MNRLLDVIQWMAWNQWLTVWLSVIATSGAVAISSWAGNREMRKAATQSEVDHFRKIRGVLISIQILLITAVALFLCILVMLFAVVLVVMVTRP